MLDVAAQSDGARRLYESAGFKIDGVRKAYYVNGDDAVLMSKLIGASSSASNIPPGQVTGFD